jgi:hypothetical protein
MVKLNSVAAMTFPLVLSLAFPMISLAQSASAGPQDLLIDKLQHISLNLPANDPSKIPVTLRLADLLAERARLASLKDLDTGCNDCDGGKADRKKALQLYKEVIAKATPEQKSKVLIQMGHLNQLLNNESEARTLYMNVLNTDAPENLAAEANLSLAEMDFKKNHYAEAKSFYQKVLNIKTASGRGLAAYRIAWCDFYTGKYPEAVEGVKAILQTPELQTRTSAAAAGQADQGFLEEVSRDLSTFLSRKSYSRQELEQVFKLSPESTRLSNVVLLANEFERTGKKAEAVEVWTFALERLAAPVMKLEALVHIAPLKFRENQTEESLKSLETALSMWTELKGCGASDCAEKQKILKGFVINWNQTEKKAPSANLQKAYALYTQVFPEDTQMQLWGAQVAQGHHDWTAAGSFFRGAIAAQEKSAKPAELESTLLSYLEMSEASKQDNLWNEAAQFYLQKSPTKSKSFEVRYQQARKVYEKGDNQNAAEALHALALDKTGSESLRSQAANLSLDALGQLKDEARLQAWSSEFAMQFKSLAKDFKEISQKTILSQTARFAATDSEAAWLTLMKFKAAEASSVDQKIYLKNKIILAEKTKRWTEAGQATEEYLKVASLTTEEREFALAQKTWLAELRLDFPTALKAFEKMTAANLKPDQKFLKMALYADLAGLDSRSYYQNFLGHAKEADLKTEIAAQLVRKSAQPEKELAQQQALLKTNPELLARLYTEIYVKNPTEKNLQAALGNHAIDETAWGKTLWRVGFFEQFKPVQNKLAAAQLDPKTQKTLTRAIKSRAQDLEALEKITASAIKKGDWSAQVVALSVFSQQTKRFYEELMSLPVPTGLTPDEESQYMNLLGQQSAPYKTKSDQAQSKVNEFWASAWKESLQKSASEAGEFHMLVEKEIEILKTVANIENQAFLAQVKVPNLMTERPTHQILELAKDDVRQSPFDKIKLEKLLDIEKQSKNFAMVQYLESRIKQLDDKGAQP